jgi:cytochrome c oxidase subunit 1
MTTLLNRPAQSQPHNKKALIERLNLFTALALGAISAFVVWRLSLAFLPADSDAHRLFTREDKITLLSMVAWFVGFMTGIGALIAPFRWVMGKDLSHEENMFYAGKDQGIKRYFRYTTDHKVVGIQYLVITMAIFGIGGILAMLIRANLRTSHRRLDSSAGL